jgi:hypothetical protein
METTVRAGVSPQLAEVTDGGSVVEISTTPKRAGIYA